MIYVLLLFAALLVFGRAEAAWNPSDKNAAVTVGSFAGQSNLYASQSSVSYVGVRGTTSHTSGKWYFEVYASGNGNTNLPGIANSSATLSNYLGSSGNAVGFQGDSNRYGGGTGGAGCIWSSIIVFAVDLTNNKLWCSANGSTWGGGGDPATNTSGQDISGIISTGIFPAWTAHEAVADAFLNTGTYGPFRFTPPSGFSGWDGSGTTLGPNGSGAGTFVAAASGAYDSSGSTGTLSGGNLTSTSGSGIVGYSNDTKYTGKLYFEVKYSATAFAIDTGIAGLLFKGGQAGVDAAGISAVFAGDGNGYIANSNVYVASTHLCTIGTNTYIGVAVDLNAGKMWCTIDGTNYENGDSPATGTGGMSLTLSKQAQFGVVAATYSTTTAATINLGASAFQFSCPSGFHGWDGAGCAADVASTPIMALPFTP